MPEYTRGNFLISTNPRLLDFESIYTFIARSYWGAGRTKEIMERALRHSLCFGVYELNSTKDGRIRQSKPIKRQVGLTRVVTDQAIYAYLCDVYILEDCRGQGLGKWMLEVVLNCPELQGLRRWVLITSDAHGFYRQQGFSELESPGKWMEIFNPPKENGVAAG